MTVAPTPRQRELLQFIAAYQASNARPPTRVEMAEALRVSRTMASIHLGELLVKRLVEQLPRAARTVRLTEAGRKAIASRKRAA